jgi:hypothetical protein
VAGTSIMARPRRCYSADSEVEGLWHEGHEAAWATPKVPPCLNAATLENSKCHGRGSHWHQTSTDGRTVTDRPTSEDHGDVPQVADFKLPALNGASGSTVPSLRLPRADRAW